MMKLSVLIICLYCLFNQSLSQVPTAHLTGLVRDKETKEAIPFATAIYYKVTELGLIVGILAIQEKLEGIILT